MIRNFKIPNLAILSILVYTFCISISTYLWRIFISFITSKWGVTNKKTMPLPPGPKPWPIIGSFPEMLLNRPTYHWIHKLMKEMDTEISCIRLGSVHVIPITSPELACEILKKQDLVFSSRVTCMSSNLISNGYLTSVFLPMGDQWMKMRKILASHVISRKSFQWLHHKRDEAADHLLRLVYNQCKQPAINLRNVTRYYCWNVISNMIFSKRLLEKRMENGGPCVEQEEEEQIDALFTLLEYLLSFGISDYLPWLSVFDLDGHKATIKKAFAAATKYIHLEIDQRIQIGRNSSKTEQEDILDVLIMLKDTDGNPLMNVKTIKAQVLELMLAMVDNPSNAVEWTLAEMLDQPELMQRALDELGTVVGSNRLVQESDLPRLNYLKACIKEAFRLYPISPFNVPHMSISDANIGQYFIPKGSVVLLSRLGLGRNPRVWKEPMKFKPERHLGEKDGEVVITDSELRLLSFSIGRRGCPAVELGTTVTVMLLARLLQGFTWSLPHKSLGINGLLVESKCDHFCAKPLFARAKPRLSKGLYPSL